MKGINALIEILSILQYFKYCIYTLLNHGALWQSVTLFLFHMVKKNINELILHPRKFGQMLMKPKHHMVLRVLKKYSYKEFFLVTMIYFSCEFISDHVRWGFRHLYLLQTQQAAVALEGDQKHNEDVMRQRAVYLFCLHFQCYLSKGVGHRMTPCVYAFKTSHAISHRYLRIPTERPNAHISYCLYGYSFFWFGVFYISFSHG